MTNFLKKSLSASLKMLVAILTFFTSACITLYVCFAINPSATLKAITGTSLQFAGAAKTSAVILAKQDDGYSLKIKSINFDNVQIANLSVNLQQSFFAIFKQDKLINIESIAIVEPPQKNQTLLEKSMQINNVIKIIFGDILDKLENLPGNLRLEVQNIQILPNNPSPSTPALPKLSLAASFEINKKTKHPQELDAQSKPEVSLRLFNILSPIYTLQNNELNIACDKDLLKFKCKTHFSISFADDSLKNAVVDIDILYKKNTNDYNINYKIFADNFVVKPNYATKQIDLKNINITGTEFGAVLLATLPIDGDIKIISELSFNNIIKQKVFRLSNLGCEHCLGTSFKIFKESPSSAKPVLQSELQALTKLFNLSSVKRVADVVFDIISSANFNKINLDFEFDLNPSASILLKSMKLLFDCQNTSGSIKTPIGNFDIDDATITSLSTPEQTTISIASGKIAGFDIIKNDDNKDLFNTTINHATLKTDVSLNLAGKLHTLPQVFKLKEAWFLHEIWNNELSGLQISLALPLKDKDIFGGMDLKITAIGSKPFVSSFFNASNDYNLNITKPANTKTFNIDANFANLQISNFNNLKLLDDLQTENAKLKCTVAIDDNGYKKIDIWLNKGGMLKSQSNNNNIAFARMIFNKQNIMDYINFDIATKLNKFSLSFNTMEHSVDIKGERLDLTSATQDISNIFNRSTKDVNKAELNFANFKMPNLHLQIDELNLFNDTKQALSIDIKTSQSYVVDGYGNASSKEEDNQEVEYQIIRSIDSLKLRSKIINATYNAKEKLEDGGNFNLEIASLKDFGAALGLQNIRSGNINGSGLIVSSNKTNRSYLDANLNIKNLSFKAEDTELENLSGKIDLSIPIFAKDHIININSINLSNNLHNIFINGNLNMQNLDIRADLKYTPSIVQKASDTKVIGLVVQGLSLFRRDGPLGLSYRIDGKIYSPRVNLGSVSFLMFKLGRGNLAKNEKR